MDQVKKPNVVNIVRQGNFELKVLAYRKMSQTELLQAVACYLKTKKCRTLPKSGSDTLVTIIGHDGL